MMNEEIKAAIVQHAADTYPAECCGLIIAVKRDLEYVRCRNISGNKDAFVIHPEDYAAAEDAGQILTVVHSHPNTSPKPSQADRVACEASGLPWLIVGYPGDGEPGWSYTEPSGYQAPLIGRQFSHGVLDCYTLVRDWYARERGITIPDFHRDADWWGKGQSLYVENFEKAGFTRLEGDPEPGDAFLMQILSNVPNHAAIYLGDGIILHHLHGRLSCREVWAGYYRKHTTHVLRYTGAP